MRDLFLEAKKCLGCVSGAWDSLLKSRQFLRYLMIAAAGGRGKLGCMKMRDLFLEAKKVLDFGMESWELLLKN